METQKIRWLHLSDFHTGKDNFAQKQLFKYILNEIKAKIDSGIKPEFVFVTGDIANKGKKEDYAVFNENFQNPLQELLGSGSLDRIFLIPGNHDVDRSKARIAHNYDSLQKVKNFLDPDAEGFYERQLLLARFKAFEDELLTERWISSEKGFSVKKISISDGKTVGILALNTAWLCDGDGDRNKLTPGKRMVEAGLDELGDCNVKIVLGHHPIDWFSASEMSAIQSLFGKHNALYLCGHLHKTETRSEEGAGSGFRTFQSGCAFDDRDEELYKNRLLWCELDLEEKQILVEPLQWSSSHFEWKLDHDAFSNRFRKAGNDKWIFPLPKVELPSASEKLSSSSLQASSASQIPVGWV